MGLLSTSYADGNTIHGSDVDAWTAAINTPGYSTTATAAGTTTLTSASNQVQVFTGTSTQTVTLPTTGIPAGNQWMVVNNSTSAVTVQSSGANTIITMAANTSAVFTAINVTPTAATDWQAQYGGINMVSGKALTVNNTMAFSAFDGAVFNFGGTPTSLTAAAAGGAATITPVATYSLPANSLSAGQVFDIQAFGTQSTTSSNCTFYLCVGTAGTSADTVVSSAFAAVAASGGSTMNGLLTIRSTGSSGTCIAGVEVVGSAFNSSNVSATTATQTINTTVQNYLTLQVKTAASTTHTMQQVLITGVSG